MREVQFSLPTPRRPRSELPSVRPLCRLLTLLLPEADRCRLWGPAYPDNTAVINQDDPLSLDPIWSEVHGRREADPEIPPEYLFSWRSENGQRGVVLETLIDIINGESVPPEYRMDSQTLHRGRELIGRIRETVPFLPGVTVSEPRVSQDDLRWTGLLGYFVPHFYSLEALPQLADLRTEQLVRALEMIEVFPEDEEDREEMIDLLLTTLEETVQGDDVSRLWQYLERMAVVVPRLGGQLV